MPRPDDRSELTGDECQAAERKWILGCIVLATIALAIGLQGHVSVTRRQQDFRHTTTCQSNLRQIGRAMGLYAQDNDERLPPAVLWPQRLHPRYLTDESVFNCPQYPVPDHVTDTPCATRLGVAGFRGQPLRGGYAVACGTLGGPQGRTVSSLGSSVEVILVYDSLGGCVYASSAACTCAGRATRLGPDYGVDWGRHGESMLRHGQGGADFVYLDGHVAWRSRGHTTPANWDPSAL